MKIWKKLTTAALVAGAAPAMLFAGAGNANALTAWAWPHVEPFGVTMHIQSTKVPFCLKKDQESTLWFPGVPTSTAWNVTMPANRVA
jgi:hypothetical protein